MFRSFSSRRSLVLLAATLLALPATLNAQRPSPPQPLDTLTVTAKRYPSRVLDLPQRVDVITRADLERTPATDLADALKKLAGVDVIQFPSLLAGIGMRGFRPQYSGLRQHTLLLVDGRPAGASNLSMIDLAAVERIEVLRGPASSLYGSSAMGGAVNVVTRRSRDALAGSVAVQYGSFETADILLQGGGRLSSRVDGDLSARLHDQGANFRIGSGNTLRSLVGGGAATKVHADGTREDIEDLGDGVTRASTRMRTESGAARVGLALSGGWRADIRGELFRADDAETPGDLFFGDAFDGRKNVLRRDVDIALSGGIGGRHRPLLRAHGSRDGFDFVNVFAPTPFVSFTTETDSWGMQAQNVMQLGVHVLTVGADWNRSIAESRSFSEPGVASAPFSPDAAVGSLAAFAEGRWEAMDGRLAGTVGGRVDRVSLDVRATPLRTDLEPGREHFTSFTPSAGLQWRATDQLRLHATAGRAFVAPDPYHVAGLVRSSPVAGVVNVRVGNRSLGAERSFTWDAGVGYSQPRTGLDLDLTYFRTVVDGRITEASAIFPEEGRPRTAAGEEVARVTTTVNAGDARMHGVEARAAVDIGTLAGGNYSLRLFTTATRLFSAEESVRFASVDAERFAGRTDFRVEEAAGAILLGEAMTSRIRNVAGFNAIAGVEYDDRRRFSSRLSGRYVSSRLDTDFTDFSNITDIEYPPHLVLDLTAGVRFPSRFRAPLRFDALITNLTDENYYEVRGYPLPGRSLALRLTVGG